MRKLCCALLAAAIALRQRLRAHRALGCEPCAHRQRQMRQLRLGGRIPRQQPAAQHGRQPPERGTRCAPPSRAISRRGARSQPVGSKADCLVGYGIGNNYVVDGTGAWPYYGGWYGYP